MRSTHQTRFLQFALRGFSNRLDEMNDRRKQPLINKLKSTPGPQYWATAARPANFGDHVQMPTKPDNWFDDNRIWNEEDDDYRTRRTKLNLFNAIVYGLWLVAGFGAVRWLYRKFYVIPRWKILDTYAEFDISNIQPGKVYQKEYMGKPIFVRLLTYEDVKETRMMDERGQWDLKTYVATTDKDDKQLLVVYGQTDHGTVPVPLQGKYGGWYCPITGQVFDKFGRTRKDGTKGTNLKYVNHVVHGNVLCLERHMPYTSNYCKYYI